MKFFNSKGKQIAKHDTAYQKQQYGVETIQIKRANLKVVIKLLHILFMMCLSFCNGIKAGCVLLEMRHTVSLHILGREPHWHWKIRL
ncbi:MULTISPECIES: hypothetical protein [Sphingobacterium]|uniref:hypothetical protein n=1 Tax=Sphingobacterium TaxID=28453 RepID=UPI00211B75F7|nr:hypothetical protein [Sphingobacterium sp. E70]ULT29226.1 hypothetical protein KUH03_40165 [Sphingobacterium sp. E70]